MDGSRTCHYSLSFRCLSNIQQPASHLPRYLLPAIFSSICHAIALVWLDEAEDVVRYKLTADTIVDTIG